MSLGHGDDVFGDAPRYHPPTIARSVNETAQSTNARNSVIRDASRMNREFRAWVRTLKPNRSIYWADFGASALVGWGAFVLALSWPLAAMISVFALWRAAYFVHEINHRRAGELPGFEPIWNLLVGVPLGLISPMVDTHTDHHRTRVYGTLGDPEYEQVATWGRLQHISSVLVSFVLPPLLALRWVLVAPLSVVPPIRRIVVARASSLVTNMSFRRECVDVRFVRYEVLAWLWWTTMSVALIQGWLHWHWALLWWAVTGTALALNQLRTNVSHAYESHGDPMSFDAQVADSSTLEGGWLTWLMNPVGTAHHALHHQFPRLAYHHFPLVHQRLMEQLPESAPYRSTVRPGIVGALVAMWTRASGTQRARDRVGPCSADTQRTETILHPRR